MNVRILIGDCRDGLRRLPDKSVHAVVTSPPYFGLRDYGTAKWEGGSVECDHLVRADPKVESSTLGGGKKSTGHQQEGFRRVCPRCGARRIDNQIGLEPTPGEFVSALVDVFREVRRVLRDDGTVWLNLGDSYAADRGGAYQPAETLGGGNSGVAADGGLTNRGRGAGYNPHRDASRIGLKHKDLIGIPWRVAFALQADGWYLRSEIIWAKPNPMPESVTDRPTKSHEHIFLLSKSERYFYDAEAVKEPGVIPAGTLGAKGSAERQSQEGVNARPPEYKVYDGRRNLRDVWTITTKPFRGAHFATFPPEIPERCIKAGTSERGACPKCGAPWTRVTETETEFAGGSGRAGRTAEEMNGSGKWRNGGTAGNTSLKLGPVVRSKTTGWAPGCDCPGNDPVPCTVLDPFGGAGTTGLVAAKFGRDAVLCELNPVFADMARTRIQDGLGGMFTTVRTEASCQK